MKEQKLLNFWDSLRTGLWFLPALMVAFGLGLALVTLQLDQGWGIEDRPHWWLYRGNPEDARTLISTLLPAIITMAALTFSVTIVALSLAANQFGSRLIRIFRADLHTQFALGLFMMTIIYCLTILSMIRTDAPDEALPYLSVTTAAVLALCCVLDLIAFIHGVARGIVADEVVRRVAADLHAAIEKLPLLPDGACMLAGKLVHEGKAETVRLCREGYVQSIDYDALVAWAEENDALIWLEFRPGDFVINGDPRILVRMPRPCTRQDAQRLNRRILVGPERTPVQDIEFPVRHLVEVAVRALSPGINDPFTATAVIDRLRGALSRLMERQLQPAVMCDGKGLARLFCETTSHRGVINAAFDQIRQAGAPKPAVDIHLLEAIARIAQHARLPEQRVALARQAKAIGHAALSAKIEDSDRRDIEESLERALAATGQP